MNEIFDSLFLLGGGALFLVMGFKNLSQYRRITGTPTSTIRSAAIGTVEIKGVASGNPAFNTPISNIPALYFHYEEQELRRVSSGKNSHKQWFTIREWDEGGFITIDDGTGQVRVTIGPENAADIHTRRVYIQPDTRSFRERLFGYPRHLGAKIEVEEKKTRNWNRSAKGEIGDRRYIETFITPGTSLYVLGYKKTDGTVGPEEGQRYIVADTQEEVVAEQENGRAKAFIGFGMVAFALGIVGLLL